MSRLPSRRHASLSLVLGAALAFAGCATTPDTPSAARTADRAATAPLMPSVFFSGGAREFTAWRCSPAQDLITAFPENELRLWSAHGAYRLAPAVVASGARYQHGELSFWDKGGEARVESPTGRLDCSAHMKRTALTRPDRPGVMFHGRGNEPGWVINLAHDKPEVTMLLNYGTRELALPYRVTTLDNGDGRMILVSGRADEPFTLHLEARACFDDMSGEPFPVRVTLDIDGESYRGCGQGIAP